MIQEAVLVLVQWLIVPLHLGEFPRFSSHCLSCLSEVGVLSKMGKTELKGRPVRDRSCLHIELSCVRNNRGPCLIHSLVKTGKLNIETIKPIEMERENILMKGRLLSVLSFSPASPESDYFCDGRKIESGS